MLLRIWKRKSYSELIVAMEVATQRALFTGAGVAEPLVARRDAQVGFELDASRRPLIAFNVCS